MLDEMMEMRISSLLVYLKAGGKKGGMEELMCFTRGVKEKGALVVKEMMVNNAWLTRFLQDFLLNH